MSGRPYLTQISWLKSLIVVQYFTVWICNSSFILFLINIWDVSSCKVIQHMTCLCVVYGKLFLLEICNGEYVPLILVDKRHCTYSPFHQDCMGTSSAPFTSLPIFNVVNSFNFSHSGGLLSDLTMVLSCISLITWDWTLFNMLIDHWVFSHVNCLTEFAWFNFLHYFFYWIVCFKNWPESIICIL